MNRFYGILAGSLIVAVATSPARAQGSMVLKGGFSYGNVSNSGILPGTIKARSGFAAGIALGSMKSLIGFGAEGLYAQRGVESTITTGDRRLDYLDIPLYLRVALPAPISPFAYAGPQVSVELRCRAGGVDCSDPGRPKRSYAGVIGGGVRLGKVSLEGRYVYGLTDLKLSTVTTTTSYGTRSFLALLGVGF